jgi:hypothetical protein
MKKQLLIAAVAATMTSVAIADISMTGDAKFEYKNKDHSGSSDNTTNTEVNLNIRAKNGNTKIFADLEFNTHGDKALHVEDLYLTTKFGAIKAKLGNYVTPTTDILGEIDNGSLATNKATFSTTFDNGVTVYAGDVGEVTGNGDTQVKASMFVGVKADFNNWKLQVEKVNNTKNAFAVANDNVADTGIGFRLENANTENKGNATFGNIFSTLPGDLSNIKVGYAWIKADSRYTITEDDSDIFAVENAGEAATRGNKQLMASMKASGNTITTKIGKIKGDGGIQDSDYYQLDVKRSLAAGTTLAVTYTKQEELNAANGADQASTKTFEVDLSVKF